LVVALRFAAGFDFEVVDFLVVVVVFFVVVLRFAADFFAAPEALPLAFAADPDEDTRDECFARCVVRFFVCVVCFLGGAVCAGCPASATPIKPNEATSATASILMVLRIIKSSASTIAQSVALG